MAKGALPALLQAVLTDLQAGRLPRRQHLAALLSKALSLGIITFSCIVKVPQILAVAQGKSAVGLAPISFELEQLGLCIHTAYGFLLELPFTAYGEAAIICVQNTYLLAQIYWYSKAPVWRCTATSVAFGTALAGVIFGRITQDLIRQAYDLNNVIFLAARVPQILQNYKLQSTGQLSTTTALANFLGCIARIFTTLQEGGGMAMVRGYMLGTLLNGAIFSQIIYYSFIRRKGELHGKKQE